MSKSIRVLVVEDSHDDALIVMRELRRGGYEPDFERVDSLEAMTRALETQSWDVILCDFTLPGFGGTEALQVLKDKGLDIPFIFVSGTITEDIAVTAMKAGARDYIIKNNLKRLVPALERELREARVRQERRQADEKVRVAERQLSEIAEFNQKIIDYSPLGILTYDAVSGQCLSANAAVARIIGGTVDDVCKMNFRNIESWKRSGLLKIAEDALADGAERQQEFHMVTTFGKEIWIDCHCIPFASESRPHLLVMVNDITQRKRAEEEQLEDAKKLIEAMQSTVEAIAMTSEIRDPYTAGHQRRVANITKAIGGEMGLSQDRIEGLFVAGVIHDIGKIYVPSDILSKPCRLNESEFGLIKMHPKAAYDILKNIKFPWPITTAIFQHHERINGSGYPMGLANGQICLEAKILAVADVMEAMVSHRPYRPALSIDKAREEITGNKGILYDADVVDACLRIIDKKPSIFH